MSNRYIIGHIENEDLTWSNSEGFTYGDDFEVYSQEEMEDTDLPEGGEWCVLVVAPPREPRSSGTS